MPPRKKSASDAATSDVQPRATRASSRLKKAADSAAPAAPPAPAAIVPKPRTKAKRSRATSDAEDNKDVAAKKPASKRTKKGKAPVADDDASMDDADDDAPEEPKKMVTILKRGAAPVDPHSGFVQSHQVYSSGGTVWDAMLNQTDVSGGQNKNKFYVLQLLHPIGNDSSCTLFTRWGRVGENGQTQKKGPFPSATAVQEFQKQFHSKTSTVWDKRVGMTAKKGKYTWLERSFEEEKEESNDEGENDKEPEKIPESILAEEIQALCRLIFSTSLIEAHLSSMNYDARKLPLGKLAKSTILNGFTALKKLSDILAKGSQANRSQIEDLTSQYYSVIPHDFGRQRPIIIDSETKLKKELELVDALGDMEIAQKLIQSSSQTNDSGEPINPLDAHFRSLGITTMDPIDRKCSEFEMLEAYAKDTHGATHRHLSISILNAFRVERESETTAWESAGHSSAKDGERLLLWHGSRTTNFAGILKQGLRIAPPEAPVTGYMFGKGVYFADMISKSANYCYSHLSGNVGLLLLCEVLAQPFYERNHAEYDAAENCRKHQKMATKGLGRTQPAKWKDAGEALSNAALNGCHMPDGPGEDVSTGGNQSFGLLYNEYIVYDPSQIRVRYLLMVQM